jgi:hypothetical protein
LLLAKGSVRSCVPRALVPLLGMGRTRSPTSISIALRHHAEMHLLAAGLRPHWVDLVLLGAPAKNKKPAEGRETDIALHRSRCRRGHRDEPAPAPRRSTDRRNLAAGRPRCAAVHRVAGSAGDGFGGTPDHPGGSPALVGSAEKFSRFPAGTPPWCHSCRSRSPFLHLSFATQ